MKSLKRPPSDERQAEREGGPLAGLACDRHVAAKCPRNAAGDRQSHPHALMLARARGIELVELLEDLLVQGRVDSVAMIGDHHARFSPHALHGDRYLASVPS